MAAVNSGITDASRATTFSSTAGYATPSKKQKTSERQNIDNPATDGGTEGPLPVTELGGTMRFASQTVYDGGNHFNLYDSDGELDLSMSIVSSPPSTPTASATAPRRSEDLPHSTDMENDSDVLDFEWTPGTRCGTKLVYTTTEKQLYQRKCKIINGYRYICRVSNCKASLYMLDDGILRRCENWRSERHIHSNQEIERNTLLFSDEMKQGMKNRLDTKPRQVYDELLAR